MASVFKFLLARPFSSSYSPDRRVESAFGELANGGFLHCTRVISSFDTRVISSFDTRVISSFETRVISSFDISSSL